jgi:hypothetical protein
MDLGLGTLDIWHFLPMNQLVREINTATKGQYQTCAGYKRKKVGAKHEHLGEFAHFLIMQCILNQ